VMITGIIEMLMWSVECSVTPLVLQPRIQNLERLRKISSWTMFNALDMRIAYVIVLTSLSITVRDPKVLVFDVEEHLKLHWLELVMIMKEM